MQYCPALCPPSATRGLVFNSGCPRGNQASLQGIRGGSTTPLYHNRYRGPLLDWAHVHLKDSAYFEFSFCSPDLTMQMIGSALQSDESNENNNIVFKVHKRILSPRSHCWIFLPDLGSCSSSFESFALLGIPGPLGSYPSNALSLPLGKWALHALNFPVQIIDLANVPGAPFRSLPSRA